MQLKNWVEIPPIPCPEFIQDKIMLASNISLNKREISIFSTSLLWLSEHLIKDNVPYNNLTRVTCIFTGVNNIEIDLTNLNAPGTYSPIIIYRVNNWRNAQYNDLTLFTIFLEELCHCQYHYEEEVQVKRKVCEILHSHIPNLPETCAYLPEALVE